MTTEDLLGLAIPVTFFLLLTVELARPGVRWPKVRGWRIVGAVFLIVTLALNAAAPFLFQGEWLQKHRLMDGGRLGTVGGVIVGYVVFTLFGYFWHRAQHRSRFLWRWSHQLHHSPNRMDLMGGLVFHPFETLAFCGINLLVTLFLLGLPALPAAIVGFVAAFYGMFQHWNIRTPRWLGVLIERPESHCLHHEKGVHARNYSDLPLWDIVFGTFENPATFEGQVGFEPDEARRIPAMLVGIDVAR